MPPRNWEERVRDILEAIRRIESYTSGLERDEFERSTLIIDAVVRNLAVIGEAARHIPEEVQAGHPEVPWHEMRRLRNFVIHEYFGVSIAVVFETVRTDLPPLALLLVRIIDEGEAKEGE